MNRCQKCNQRKPESEFPFIRRGEPQRRSTCRACIAADYRNWSQRNRISLLERKRRYWHDTDKQRRNDRRNDDQ